MNPTSLPATLFRKRQFVQVDTTSSSLPATLARTRWLTAELYREGVMVSARGGKYGFVYTSRHRAYRGIRRSGASKTKAAKIANAGRTAARRSAMARKGWRTRRGRKR